MRNIKTSIKIIETAVCFVMGVSEAQLRIRTRKQNIKTARHLIYYLQQCEFDVIDCNSQSKLARRYRQNHEIVIHARNRIKEAIDTVNGKIVDSETNERVKQCRKLIYIFTENAIVKDGTNYKKQMRNAYLPLIKYMENYNISLSIHEMNDIIIACDQVSLKIKEVMRKNMN